MKKVNFFLLGWQPVVGGVFENIVEAKDSDESKARLDSAPVADVLCSEGTVKLAV